MYAESTNISVCCYDSRAIELTVEESLNILKICVLESHYSLGVRTKLGQILYWYQKMVRRVKKHLNFGSLRVNLEKWPIFT